MSGKYEKPANAKGIENTRKARRNSTTSSNELVGAKGSVKQRLSHSSSALENGFHTDKYKTKNSAWTPVMSPAFNNQIFYERLELIGHWLSMWTDAQRKKFLTFVLKRCTKSQLKFVNENWFKKQLPIHHLDFTTVLPRFLSMYVFSYLDPRSLCRAAQVSWHWKFICEQDEIWVPKCVKFGWYLPYAASNLEYGAWKEHYIMCTSTLDMHSPKKMAELYGKFVIDYNGNVEEQLKRKEKEKLKKIKREEDSLSYKELAEGRRPPWLDTDPKPKDLDMASRALLYGENPNQPCTPTTLRSQKQRLTSTSHQRSLTAPLNGSLTNHKVGKRTRSVSDNLDVSEFHVQDSSGSKVCKQLGKEPIDPSTLTLSEALAVESGVEEGLVEQPWPKTIPNYPVRRRDLTVGVHPRSHDSLQEMRPAAQSCRDGINQRIVFISSEIPACELLLEAVMLGVIAIPYEYEGTTLDTLLEKLKLVLKGRQAKSIGIFVSGESGCMRLVRGRTLSESNVFDPDIRHFWEVLTSNVQPRLSAGHVDLFLPLTETEGGMELLVQLEILTDMQFSCPTGITGSYARVDSEWLYSPNGVAPPALYFNTTKMGAWSSTVGYIEECVKVVKTSMESFFSEERINLAKRLVGKIMFEALGLCEIFEMSQLTPLLVNAFVSLAKDNQSNKVDARFRLVEYLKTQQEGWKPRKVRRTTKEDDEEDIDKTLDVKSDEEGASDAASDAEYASSKPGAAAGEKRTLIAHELLSSEVKYMRSLAIIQDNFKTPLQAAVASNRAILGSANIQTIFTDLETLLSSSSNLADDLSNRMDNWDSHQCLGDIFLKFCTQLRAYSNFLNNYPAKLQTLARCKEQNPQFRAFLARHERQPDTKMLSLPELFLLPGRRINRYIELLETFLHYTPSDHVDRKDVVQSIKRLKDMANLFKQYQQRLKRERFLYELRDRIVNCPVLAERNRNFICQEDVVTLSSPNVGREVKPEFRVYQQVGDLGLFLFNDALIVATLTFKHVPFQRLVQQHYKFQACVSLRKLKVENMADSKYVKNAFIIVSPKRLWTCQAHSWDQKFRWISVLENAITSAVDKT